MSVFSKLKQFKDLRDQGKKLQDALSGESATVTSGGVAITMDGNFQLTGVAIDEELLNPAKKEKLQNAIKDAHGDAIKKMQRIMASKMQEMGGMEGLLGKNQES
jgi:DNA-binding YbaB/EbfC family protein